jgi:hypothetical protein
MANACSSKRWKPVSETDRLQILPQDREMANARERDRDKAEGVVSKVQGRMEWREAVLLERKWQ